MSNKIKVTTTINADAKRVWDYYTNPTHIVKWNFADPSWHCPSAENDMKIGGTYKARMEAKDGSFGFDFEAVYEELEIGRSFTYAFGDRKSTVEFVSNNNNQTTVVVTFDPEKENPIEMQKGGWQSILDNFKSYTELN
ncbi:MAG TPA: SRPBCC family protein [Segetibacter sp.]